MTMRVMKAFQIEASYQKHRTRLTSIQGLNTKKKVLSTASRNMEKINNYKKHRLTAQIFTEKQKVEELAKGNCHLQKTLTKVYNRDSSKKLNSTFNLQSGKERSLNRISSKSSIKSINSQSRLRVQNKKMVQKLSNMKSTYSKFRQTSSQGMKNQTVYSNNTDKNRQQIVRILEMQLGKKPTVLFPRVKKRRQAENEEKSRGKTNKNLDGSYFKVSKSGSLSLRQSTSRSKI